MTNSLFSYYIIMGYEIKLNQVLYELAEIQDCDKRTYKRLIKKKNLCTSIKTGLLSI